jgi:RNA polymerase sigma-70 factor (ECF subfamily)
MTSEVRGPDNENIYELLSPERLNPEVIAQLTSGDNRQYMINKLKAFTGSWVDVEDILHDAVVKALKYWKNFNGDGSASAWFHSVSLNAASTFYKSKNRKPTSNIDLAPELYLMDPAQSPEETVVEGLIGQELADQIKEHANQLSDKSKRIIGMLALGLSYRLIAEHFDMSVSAIKVRVHRARKILKESMDGQ